MADPAVEAVRRAIANNGDWPWDSTAEAMREAAREMAQPIREVIDEYRVGFEQAFIHPQLRAFINRIAPLVYPTEELQN